MGHMLFFEDWLSITNIFFNPVSLVQRFHCCSYGQGRTEKLKGGDEYWENILFLWIPYQNVPKRGGAKGCRTPSPSVCLLLRILSTADLFPIPYVVGMCREGVLGVVVFTVGKSSVYFGKESWGNKFSDRRMEVKLPALLGSFDRPIDRPTSQPKRKERRGHREVSLPMIL